MARRQGGAAAEAAQAGLLVQVLLVAQACEEVAAFAWQVFVLIEAVAEDAVGFGVVVGIAVGPAAALLDPAVQVGAGVAVVVGAYADLLLDDLVARLQRPYAVLPAAAEPGLRAVRQFDVELVTALAIEKLDDL